MRTNIQSAKSANVPVSARQNGLVAMLFQIWTARKAAGAGRVRQMKLLETLPLGGKRQLMLVQCGSEHFLVGGGLETVETIVKVAGVPEASRRSQDDLCG